MWYVIYYSYYAIVNISYIVDDGALISKKHLAISWYFLGPLLHEV